MITRVAEGLVILTMSLMGLGAGSIVGDAIKTDIVGMRLISFGYDQGVVTQVHEVYGVDLMQASWAVNVTRDRKYICSGNGVAPYEHENFISMTLNEWVGADCPDMEVGDKLLASWEWVGRKGVRHRISGSLVIK